MSRNRTSPSLERHLAAMGSWEIDGRIPSRCLLPGSIAEVQDVVSEAQAQSLALIPWGGGSEIRFGNDPTAYDAAVLTDKLRAIEDYSAPDMVVTAGAGLPLASLQSFLSGYRQHLPIEAPKGATLGGIVAGATAGRRCLSRGTPRDWLAGMKAVTGTGAVFRAGGRVVKNVTGYDLCKLMVGSRGTLGIICELSFKVTPLPECVLQGKAVLGRWTQAEIIRQAAQEFGAAWLDLVAREDRLCIDLGLEGYEADVALQREGIERRLRLGEVNLPDWVVQDPAGSMLPAPCNPQMGADLGVTLEVRMGLPPDKFVAFLAERALQRPASIDAHLASGLGTVAFASPEPLEDYRRLCQLASQTGGWVTLSRGPKGDVDVYDPPPGICDLSRRLKCVFDPSKVLSPGRAPGRV